MSMKLILFFSIVMFNISVKANTQRIIESLMPEGYSLAQEYLYKQDPSLDKDDLIYRSSVIHDFNQDGLEDIAMLVEKTVCLIPTDQGVCAKDYYYAGESRKLMVYFAKDVNKYELFLETENGVLNYGESANEYKDPLYSFTVDSEGTLSISYSGGTELSWNFDIEVRFISDVLKPDFYLTAVRSVWSEWAIYPTKITNDFITMYLDRNFLSGHIETMKYLTSQQQNQDDGFEQVFDKKELPLLPLRFADEELIFKSNTKD